MSCSECRGYNVSRCPVCMEGFPKELPESVQNAIDEINADPGMCQEAVHEKLCEAAKIVAESEEDFDGLYNRAMGEIE